MTAFTWTDSQSDGDISDADNYTPGGGPPGAGDDIYAAATQPSDMTTNMAAFTALLFGSVEFGEGYGGDQPGFRGNVGSAGAPLKLSAANLTYRGSGIIYFENGSTSDTDDVIIDAPSGKAVIGCDTALISRIAALRGDVTLTSTLTGLLDLFVGRSAVTIEGANLIVDAFVDANGVVTCFAPITNLDISGAGAVWTQLVGAGAIANMVIGDGATVVYNTTNTITGDVIVKSGGLLQLSKDTRPKDIGNLRVFDGGHVMRGSTAVSFSGGKLSGVQDIV